MQRGFTEARRDYPLLSPPEALWFGPDIWTRLCETRRGADMLLLDLHAIIDGGAQLAVLGSGERALETAYRRAAAEHHDLLLTGARGHGEDARPDRRHHRRVAGEYAEITLDAGNVDLIDLAGEGDLFGRNQIEEDFASHRLYAASAAIFCALATASSMVPTM